MIISLLQIYEVLNLGSSAFAPILPLNPLCFAVNRFLRIHSAGRIDLVSTHGHLSLSLEALLDRLVSTGHHAPSLRRFRPFFTFYLARIYIISRKVLRRIIDLLAEKLLLRVFADHQLEVRRVGVSQKVLAVQEVLVQQLVIVSCVLMGVGQVHEGKGAGDRHARGLVVVLLDLAAQLSVPEHFDILDPLLLVRVAQVQVVWGLLEVLLDVMHDWRLYFLARQYFATGPARV